MVLYENHPMYLQWKALGSKKTANEDEYVLKWQKQSCQWSICISTIYTVAFGLRNGSNRVFWCRKDYGYTYDSTDDTSHDLQTKNDREQHRDYNTGHQSTPVDFWFIFYTDIWVVSSHITTQWKCWMQWAALVKYYLKAKNKKSLKTSHEGACGSACFYCLVNIPTAPN